MADQETPKPPEDDQFKKISRYEFQRGGGNDDHVTWMEMDANSRRIVIHIQRDPAFAEHARDEFYTKLERLVWECFGDNGIGP